MSVRQVKVHGRKVWQARVAYRGRRRALLRAIRMLRRGQRGDVVLRWIGEQIPEAIRGES